MTISKGQWRVFEPSGQGKPNGRRIMVKSDGGPVCDCDWNSPQENMANAKAIAAIPAMLDFLTRTARGCCLKQESNGKCICCACHAQRIIDSITA
jgi:hypothetical protein